MIVIRQIRGLGAPASTSRSSAASQMVSPEIVEVQRQAAAHAQTIIETTGETVEEDRSPLDELESGYDQYISDIAPPGGTLRTWGPPIALGLVVLGAVWWLRK